MVPKNVSHRASAVIGSIVVLAVASAAGAEPTATKEAAVVKRFDDSELKWGPAPAFLPKGTELTVLHGDPTKKNADVLLRIPAKATVAEHWHTSAERMILLAGELQVTYAGQPPAVMKAGSYAYGPAKAKHSAVCLSDVPCVLFIAFESPVDAVPVAKASN